MAEMTPVTINIGDICDDDTFRISRPLVSDVLARSLRELGMLEKPYLIKSGDGLVPLTCHNRILALREQCAGTVESFVLEQFDPAVFINNTAIKVRRGEVGPAGKCRALMTAVKFSLYDDPARFCKRVLNVSADILDADFAMRVLSLPVALKNYIDIKDAGFKTVRDLVSLPQDMIEWLDSCVSSMQVRVNIFKLVVDYLFDLGKKIPHADLPVMDAPGADDRHVLDTIYRMRFPGYSRLKDRADELAAAVSSRGVSVDFPEFFEGDSFRLSVDVRVRDSEDDIRARLDGIDTGKLCELAKLLK